MTYAKLFFVNSDFILGYQTINQGIDNLDAVYDGMSIYHETSETSDGLGRHKTDKIPRDVLLIQGTVLATSSFGSSPGSLGAASATRPITRISTGVYFVPVYGLSSWWGRAVAHVSSSTPIPLINCLSVYPSSQYQQPGITVTCYELGTGSLVATDFDFSLVISGTK